MELKALRTFRFGDRNIRRGEPVEMTDAQAKDHAARGLVPDPKAGKQDAPKGESPPAKPDPKKPEPKPTVKS
ncbi:hypothetical protein ACLBXM_17940 [Xanthobacteraceae bacterium A53D]